MLFDAEYNREHNVEKAVTRVNNRFSSLKGAGPWRTKELNALGFSNRNIQTFVKHGLLKKIYQGLYAKA